MGFISEEKIRLWKLGGETSIRHTKALKYLVDVVVVEDAVEVLVDVVEHVDHFHGGAVVAQCGKSHNVTEIDGHLLKQLWFHLARLLQ